MSNILNFISRGIYGLFLVILSIGMVSGFVLTTGTVGASAQSACGTQNDRLPGFGNACIGGTSTFTGDRTSIANLVRNVINYVIFILAGVSVGFIVYGGVLFITDDGSGSNAGKGKKIVIYALAGLVIAIVSFTLVTVVVNIVNSLGSTSTPNGGGDTGPVRG